MGALVEVASRLFIAPSQALLCTATSEKDLRRALPVPSPHISIMVRVAKFACVAVIRSVLERFRSSTETHKSLLRRVDAKVSLEAVKWT